MRGIFEVSLLIIFQVFGVVVGVSPLLLPPTHTHDSAEFVPQRCFKGMALIEF